MRVTQNETVLESVVAAYPFSGVEAKHMSFAKGSSIEVLEKQDEWWRGRLKDGTTGWFPKNYVQADAPVKKKEAKRAAPKPPGAKGPEPVKPAEPEPVAPAVTFIAAFNFQGEQVRVIIYKT